MTAIGNLLGRVCLGLIFLLSGLSKLGAFDATAAQIAQHHIPFPTLAGYLTITIEVFSALAIMTGYRARSAAFLLFLFLIPVTFLFHFQPAMAVDSMIPEFEKKMHFIHVLKNIAIQGGLLLVATQGPGAWSLGKGKSK